jgi:hypothetical protein
MDFQKYFSLINDPRDIRKIDHLLTDIIGLALIGTIAGCEGYEDIEDFGNEKRNGFLNSQPSKSGRSFV